jgi:hypothetical protein
VKIPANSTFTPGAGINIVECAAPGGVSPSDPSQCDGLTVQSDTILANSDGSVDYKVTNSTSGYEVFALPDSVSLGEHANGTPVCNSSNECVLYVGENQNDFTAPHFFSQPFFVGANGNDSGANPGDGSAERSQAITFTSTPPSPAAVGGTYTPAATGGASGNPVVFSIDASSTAGACSVSAGVVHFASGGTCKIDANQAGNSQFTAAPSVSQSVTITGPPGRAFTSANNATTTEGVPFSFHVTTSGTPAPKLKEHGKLPKGIKFHKGIGSATISGTANPKKNKTVGTYHVTITATYGKGKTKQLVTQAFTLRVNL